MKRKSRSGIVDDWISLEAESGEPSHLFMRLDFLAEYTSSWG